MSIRQRPGTSPRPEISQRARRRTAIELNRQLSLDREVRQVYAYMAEVRAPDEDLSDMPASAGTPEDEFFPDSDDDDDEGEDDAAVEPVDELWWQSPGPALPEPAFRLDLGVERATIVWLLADDEMAALYPGTVEFVRFAIGELELVLNERLALLRSRLAQSTNRGRFVGVTELAWRIVQHYEVDDREEQWALCRSMRPALSAFVNQERIWLPPGRCEVLAWFFPPQRGSDVATDTVILDAAARAMMQRPAIGNLTELAEALMDDHDAALRAWIGQLRGMNRANSVSARLRRLFETYADAILDGAAWGSLDRFVRQVIVNGQRSRRWQSRPRQ